MSRIPALIRMLSSPNDNEVLQAARALVRELANHNAHLDDLAKTWEEAEARQLPPHKTKAFDFSKVETAVTLYAQDKTRVTMNKTIRAVKEMIADVPHDHDLINRYIIARLFALGFTPSSSGASFSRG